MKQKTNVENHRRREMNLSSPHSCQPVKDLNAGRNRDRHGRKDKEGVGMRTHAYGEHVMRPHAYAHEGDCHTSCHHDGITEDGLAGEYWNDLGDVSERGDHQNVNFRMAEDPEEVHPQYGGAPRLSVEEVSAQIAVDSEHDLRRRQRTDGNQNDTAHHAI